jgi:hypothetical protein
VRGDDGVARAAAAAVHDDPLGSGRDIVLRMAKAALHEAPGAGRRAPAAVARMLCYVLPMTIEEMRHETDHDRGMRGRILGGDSDGC